MEINQVKFERVVAAAKAKTTDAKWLRAIDRAAKEIISGEMIVTVLAHGALITTANGTYAADGHCNCKAALYGHKECAHRAGARLMELYEAEPEIPAPCITRSVERDVVTRRRVKVTRVDGWVI